MKTEPAQNHTEPVDVSDSAIEHQGIEQPSEAQHNNANEEAKRYRLRLRDTEQERDTAREQLAQARRAHLATYFDGTNGRPKMRAFEALGYDPADYFTEHGNLNYDKIKKTESEIREAFGSTLSAPYAPDEGNQITSTVAPSWTDVLR